MAKPRTSGHECHYSKEDQAAARSRAILSQRGDGCIPLQPPPHELEAELKEILAHRPPNMDIPAITKWVWERDRILTRLTLSRHQWGHA